MLVFPQIENLGLCLLNFKASGGAAFNSLEGADEVCIVVEARQNAGLLYRMTEIKKFLCFGDLAQYYVVVEGYTGFGFEYFVEIVFVDIKT